MRLGERAVDVDELEPDDLEAALLVAGEDPPDQLALDAVGLDEDEGSFSGCMSSLGTVGVDAAVLYRMGGEGQAGASVAVPADGSARRRREARQRVRRGLGVPSSPASSARAALGEGRALGSGLGSAGGSRVRPAGDGALPTGLAALRRPSGQVRRAPALGQPAARSGR